MASNNSKYSEEMRIQTAEYILKSDKSATSLAEKINIGLVDKMSALKHMHRNWKLSAKHLNAS